MVIEVGVGGRKCLLRLRILLGSEVLQVFDSDETVKPCWDWRRMEGGLGLVRGANSVVGLEDVVGAWGGAGVRPLKDASGVVRLQDDGGGLRVLKVGKTTDRGRVRLQDVGGATGKGGIRFQNLGRRTDRSRVRVKNVGGATVGL